ncbi:hypothetical protein HGRIS_012257 [Hohenbuehelia grisea]|uniref:Uncharacterized protein n=1 Tax=Hohenbuehelia grisea TaxID=104357 RepID=A0ABR3IRS6_9AGAR
MPENPMMMGDINMVFSFRGQSYWISLSNRILVHISRAFLVENVMLLPSSPMCQTIPKIHRVQISEPPLEEAKVNRLIQRRSPRFHSFIRRAQYLALSGEHALRSIGAS